MSETTTTPAPASASTPAPIVFTMEEQLTSSLVLYGLSLVCIIVGGIRSGRFVHRSISKGRKLEASITWKEARFFPLTASAVLFGLYLFFNPEKVSMDNVKAHVPAPVYEAIVPLHAAVSDKWSAWAGSASSERPPLMVRLLEHLPESVRLPLDDFLDVAVYPLWEMVPKVTKAHCMTFLLLVLCFEGCVALAALLKPLFSFFLRFLPFVGTRTPYLFSIKKGKKEMEEGDIEEAPKKDTEYMLKIEWDTHDAVAILLCLSVAISHLYKRHWITNNILGVAFSIYGIENLHLSSFKAGTLLLVGLFFYDIFWVFATDVMTTVAKGIDAPILLQFPQDIYRNGWEASKYSMLGLGDIVIPGIFIALLRRFDHRIGDLQLGSAGLSKKASTSLRVYFWVTIVAYALGLFITMGVMHHFKRAQPALLYLVPTCLLIPLLLSVCRGEFSLLWNYSEDHFVEKEETPKKVSEEKKKK